MSWFKYTEDSTFWLSYSEGFRNNGDNLCVSVAVHISIGVAPGLQKDKERLWTLLKLLSVYLIRGMRGLKRQLDKSKIESYGLSLMEMQRRLTKDPWYKAAIKPQLSLYPPWKNTEKKMNYNISPRILEKGVRTSNRFCVLDLLSFFEFSFKVLIEWLT